MRVGFMQAMDFWVGIPLCFLFSVIHRALSPFRGPLPKPSKILFIELSEMGSAIIAHSSLERARDRDSAEVYFLIFERNKESVSLLGSIPEERIITIRDENFLSFALSMIGTLFTIRRLGIDTAIDLELFSRCTALITFLCGARNRVGFDRFTNEGLYRGSFLTHRVLYNHHQHMALNFMALVESLEADRHDLPMLKKNVSGEIRELPQLRFTDEERSVIRALLGEGIAGHRIVVFNPDPGLLPLRGWPLDRFCELAERLVTSDPRLLVVVIGLSRSRPYADAILSRAGSGRCLDLTGRTKSMREVACLLSMSDLLITNDSGPAHLASLTKVRSVVLFGPETPSLYGPLGENVETIFAGLSCSPCFAASNHRRTICRNNRCLQEISVEDVERIASQQLSRAS